MSLVDRAGIGAAIWVAAGTAIAVPLVAAQLWRPVIALPVLLVALAVAVRVARLVPSVQGPRWAAAALVVVAVGAGVWAGATHAEQVVLRRDAGTYALYGHHLATKHGLPVDVDVPALGGAAALRLATVASPGFFAQGSGAKTYVVPQFLPATPVWLSLGWWAGGWTGLLLVPAVALAFALLAFGALARRLVGPGWAVLATAALALTQPVLHAGRSTYSEPFALLVGCAAMAVLVAATQADPTGRRLARTLGLIAGLLLGSVALVRVDALRESALLLPVVGLLAWRRSAVARPLLAGVAVATAFAAVTALVLSWPYIQVIAGSLRPLLAAAVVLGGGSWLALRLVRAGRVLPARVARAGPWLLGGAVLLGFALLTSRPLWLVARQPPNDPGVYVVGALQLRQGLVVDGGRTYDEASLQWVAWWVGVPALVLALGAAVVLAHRLGVVLGDGQPLPGWLAPAVVGVASTALTLYRPGITPDHPWADRRLVSVVLPAVLLLATAALAHLPRHFPRHFPALASLSAVMGPHNPHLVRQVRVVVGVGLLLGPAAWATWPVAGQRTERGQVEAVRRACAAFGPLDTAILVDSRAANEWPQVLRGVCEVPSLVIRPRKGRLDAAAVRQVAAAISAAGRRPVLVTAESPDPIAALGLTPRQVVQVETIEDQRLLKRRPAGSALLDVDLWLGPVSSGSS